MEVTKMKNNKAKRFLSFRKILADLGINHITILCLCDKSINQNQLHALTYD